MRVRHTLGQQRVVGKQQQPTRIFVQPADRTNEGGNVLDQVIHRRPAFRVAVARDKPGWLVEQDVDFVEGLHSAPIQLDAVLQRVDPFVGILDNLAIHLDASFVHPTACVRARPQARLGNHTLQCLGANRAFCCFVYWAVHILFTVVN